MVFHPTYPTLRSGMHECHLHFKCSARSPLTKRLVVFVALVAAQPSDGLLFLLGNPPRIAKDDRIASGCSMPSATVSWMRSASALPCLNLPVAFLRSGPVT
jgi:hypothetical protein